MKQRDLSVVIPARNEAEGLYGVVSRVLDDLDGIDFEVWLIDDYSTDETQEVMRRLASEHRGTVRVAVNGGTPGIGVACRLGLTCASGEYVCFYMSDESEEPALIRSLFYAVCFSHEDAAFGNRWSGASIEGYPLLKRVLNRIGNRAAAVLIGEGYTDWTNIFKLYRADALRAVPLTSTGFEIGLEMSLKVVKSGAKFAVVDTPWKERKSGSSKMRLFKNAWRCLGVLWRETMR